jgi:hypothetical protein
MHSTRGSAKLSLRAGDKQHIIEHLQFVFNHFPEAVPAALSTLENDTVQVRLKSLVAETRSRRASTV